MRSSPPRGPHDLVPRAVVPRPWPARLQALVGLLTLVAAGACRAPREAEPALQTDADGPDLGLDSAPLRDDPDHAGVYETETPRRAVDGDSPAEEEAKGGEWFVAPVPSYNPQSEYGLALLGGHIFSLDPDDEATPPSVVAAGGFYTTNGSGGGFGSFKGYLPGDRWRVMAAAGSVGVDYDFYGIGQGEEDLAVPIRTLADFLEVEFLRQLGSAWYLGPSFVTSRTDSRIRTGGLPPGIGADELLLQDTALGLHLQRDTRDDVFYPTSGSLLDAEADFFSTSWGRDGFYYYLSVGQAF